LSRHQFIFPTSETARRLQGSRPRGRPRPWSRLSATISPNTRAEEHTRAACAGCGKTEGAVNADVHKASCISRYWCVRCRALHLADSPRDRSLCWLLPSSSQAARVGLGRLALRGKLEMIYGWSDEGCNPRRTRKSTSHEETQQSSGDVHECGLEEQQSHKTSAHASRNSSRSTADMPTRSGHHAPALSGERHVPRPRRAEPLPLLLPPDTICPLSGSA